MKVGVKIYNDRMTSLRYQRVINLETQVIVTSQKNKWANIDLRTYFVPEMGSGTQGDKASPVDIYNYTFL
jgi:hypothetical protein